MLGVDGLLEAQSPGGEAFGSPRLEAVLKDALPTQRHDAVRKALGDPAPLPQAVTMKAGEDLPAIGPRREFLRAAADGDAVHLAGSQDSSALSALAQADCLIDRPAHAAALAAGEQVRVFKLQNG